MLLQCVHVVLCPGQGSVHISVDSSQTQVRPRAPPCSLSQPSPGDARHHLAPPHGHDPSPAPQHQLLVSTLPWPRHLTSHHPDPARHVSRDGGDVSEQDQQCGQQLQVLRRWSPGSAWSGVSLSQAGGSLESSGHGLV